MKSAKAQTTTALKTFAKSAVWIRDVDRWLASRASALSFRLRSLRPALELLMSSIAPTARATTADQPVALASGTTFSLTLAVHRRGDRGADGVGGLPDRIGVEMRIARRRSRRWVAEQRADHRQSEPAARADAGEAVSEIMKTKRVEPRATRYGAQGRCKSARGFAGSSPAITKLLRRGRARENGEGRGVQNDRFSFRSSRSGDAASRARRRRPSSARCKHLPQTACR